MLFSQSYGVFSNNGLAGRRVCSDKNGVTHFQVIDGLFLKCIKLKGVLNDLQRCNGASHTKQQTLCAMSGNSS
jgi:hypothetical protein